MTPEELLQQLRVRLAQTPGHYLRFENAIYNRFGSPENAVATLEQQIEVAEEILAQPRWTWVQMLPEILQSQEREEAEKQKRLEGLLKRLGEEVGKRLRFENELLINFPDDSANVDQRLTLAEEILSEPCRGEVGQRWEEHRRRRLRE